MQVSSENSDSIVPSEAPLQEPNNIIEVEPEPSLRRSQRSRRSAISDDYEVYASQEIVNGDIYVSEYIDEECDPTTYEKAARNENSSK